MSLTYRVRTAYLASKNLNRDIRNEADGKIADLNDGLYRLIRGEGDPSVINEWITRISDICLPILNSRRFSELITVEIKNYIRQGSEQIRWLINQAGENDSKGQQLSGEAKKEIDKGLRIAEDRIISSEHLEILGIPSMSFLDKKRKRANRTSPTQGESPTKISPPSKRHEEDKTPDAEDRTKLTRPEVTIRVKVKEKLMFVTKLKTIKAKVNTEDVRIIGVRKCRDVDDILIKVANIQEAETLANRIRNIGEEVEILTDVKRRLHILNLDASVEDMELRKCVSDAAEIAVENTRIVYRRDGYAGSQSACIELPGRALRKCLSQGTTLRIGWTRCKIREFAVSRACFRCAETGHRAETCPNQPGKICYKCGSNKHLMKDCQETATKIVRKRERRYLSEKYLPGAYLPGTDELVDSDAELQEKMLPENRERNINKKTMERSNSPISTEIRRMTRELKSRETREKEKVQDTEGARDQCITIGRVWMDGNKGYREMGTQTMWGHMGTNIKDDRTGSTDMTWSQVVKKAKRPNRVGSEAPGGIGGVKAKENNLLGATHTPLTGKRKKQFRTSEKWLNSKAIYITMEDKNFMDILMHIKSKAQCPTGDTGIRKIRKARTGAVLLELDDNAAAQEWKDRILGTEQDKKISARILSRKTMAKIRGLDILTEAKGVINAIGEATAATPDELEQVQLLRMIDEPWQERVAIIRIPVRLANELQETKGIKIGWTINKVRIMDKPNVRCNLSNLNNSTAAMDVLTNYMDSNGVEMAIVAEPPRNIRGAWISSLCGKATIGLRGRLAGRAGVLEQEHNAVAISVNSITVVSCYFPPSLDFPAFEKGWGEVTEWIKDFKIKGFNRLIVAGDFNAQDHLWATRSDRRGKTIAESLLAHDFICLNDGKPTCIRWNGCTAIDATFATPNIAKNIHGWHISMEETLSDHRFIPFCIHDAQKAVRRGSNSTTPAKRAIPKDKKRWVAGSVKTSKLEKEINEWELDETPTDLPGNRMTGLYDKIVKICDRTMKTIKTGAPRRKNTYWWNDHTAKARRECNVARRALSRMKTKIAANLVSIEQAENRYRTARNNYRLAIKISKRKSWNDLIKDVDKNPWGLAYKIINDKLRIPTYGGILTLDENDVRRVIGELFPPGPSLDDLKKEEKQLIIDNKIHALAIDNCEVQAAARRINIRKAPGPDNIPGIIIKKLGLIKPESIRQAIQALMNHLIFPEIWKKARIVMIPKIELRDLDDNVVVLCFADDTAILTRATTHAAAVEKCQEAITRFIDITGPLGLVIAEEKTEFLVYRSRNTKFREYELNVKGHKVVNKVTAKYLGITLDDKLTFSPHIRGLVPRVAKVMATLGRILPNLGGPMEPRRKMLATVGLSVALYGAPIWSGAAAGVINRRYLERARRACALRVCAAYRTAPTEALGILAGIPPLDITAKMRRNQFMSIREYIGYPDIQDAHTRRYRGEDVAMLGREAFIAANDIEWIAAKSTNLKGGFVRRLREDSRKLQALFQEVLQRREPPAASRDDGPSLDALSARISALEAENAALRRRVQELERSPTLVGKLLSPRLSSTRVSLQQPSPIRGGTMGAGSPNMAAVASVLELMLDERMEALRQELRTRSGGPGQPLPPPPTQAPSEAEGRKKRRKKKKKKGGNRGKELNPPQPAQPPTVRSRPRPASTGAVERGAPPPPRGPPPARGGQQAGTWAQVVGRKARQAGRQPPPPTRPSGRPGQ
ncbi:unnamed protein product, partial [Xylocopa violacea]